ncbi:MAG: GGDEF domain-containing protein [Acetobacterium sp.]
MPELRKIVVFIFVSLLFIYMVKLLYVMRHKKENLYIFIIMNGGLLLLAVATFLDMIAKNSCIAYIYIIMKLCFTGGAILYIIGMILWTDFTKKMNGELERMASIDSLTGTLNRNGLIKVFDVLVKRKIPFYFLVGDLDGTKLINDTLGHLEGDKFICNTANIMTDAVRNHGHISRIGGDEFVIIFENQDSHEAAKIIDTIRKKVSMLYPETNSDMSIGAAIYPSDGQTFEALFKVSDTQMYESKRKKIRKES